MISGAELNYLQLITAIEEFGVEKHPSKGSSRAIFGYTIVLEPNEVPLLQSRKIYWKGLVGELKAFLANENTVAGFEKQGCNFWGSWANDDGSLDVDYARLLHDFNGVNQLERLLGGLRNKPDSRKHVISLWDPSSEAKQVPCVLSYQWSVNNGVLEMIWTQRSADVMVGLASDMFSAWLFNRLVAITVGLEPGRVTMNIGDAHIYDVHKEPLELMMRPLFTSGKPTAFSLDGNIYDFEFDVYDYNPREPIKFELLK